MSSRPINPLPVCPVPIQWDVPARIAELQAIIDDPATSEAQKINLQAVIKLYHDKVFPGPMKWIQDGKVVLLKDINFHQPYWSEGFAQQLSAQTMIPALELDTSSAQPQCVSENVHSSDEGKLTNFTLSAFESATCASHDLQILARIRPVPGLLPSPSLLSIEVSMLNDTGSDALTVFDSDILALAIPPTYGRFGPIITVAMAGGTVWQQ
ncbi:conserved hypothetical protein [Histoplasma capsulatum H143]|uniref:Uncharacterized protein n=1 Tax=Ajellomyces capsulatus (strain H143) TaxID=544712 RepID=C6HRY2_AJECH|nr:conserved hypothetical protein [Histoplasma capsulatum H143]